MLSFSPASSWRRGLERLGLPEAPETVWLQSELLRHSTRDLTEAGRDLGRFDSRPWLHTIDVPTAVVITTRDKAVPPEKQRELAAAARAEVFEAPINHLQIVTRTREYNPQLLAAIAAVKPSEDARAA
jgi:hypothetical protein